jgi:hypothetical protein
MTPIRSPRPVVAALLALLAAACQDGTGPGAGESFDARAALEDYETFGALLTSPGFSGLGALEAHLPAGALVPASGPAPGLVAALAPALERLAREHDPRAFAVGLVAEIERVRSARPAVSGVTTASAVAPARAPLISQGRRGSTFVYDPELGEYVIDPDRTGAPADGVRFVVYEETRDGRPDPAREVGWADLIDEGDDSAEDVALRLVVVMDGDPCLDYRTTVDERGGHGVVTVDGFLEHGGERLDFDIDVSGSDAGVASTIDVAFEMRIDRRSFAITGSLRGGEAHGGTGDVDIEVRHGSASLRVDVSGTDTAIDGTFWLDGGVFATVSGDPDAPVFTSADGDPLTFHEIAVLFRILAVVAEVLQLFQHLVAPVGHLVLLGIVL